MDLSILQERNVNSPRFDILLREKGRAQCTHKLYVTDPRFRAPLSDFIFKFNQY
jgi:hypothetical protein